METFEVLILIGVDAFIIVCHYLCYRSDNRHIKCIRVPDDPIEPEEMEAEKRALADAEALPDWDPSKGYLVEELSRRVMAKEKPPVGGPYSFYY